MECKKISRLIPLFIDNAIPPENKKELQEHLIICKECKKYAEAIHNQKKQLKRAFQSLMMPDYLADDISLMIKNINSFKIMKLLKSWRNIILAAAIIIIAVGIIILIYERGGIYANRSSAYYYEAPELTRISGKIVCIGCELRRMYGLPIDCSHGHKLVMKTKDGDYFNYQAAEYIKELLGNDIYGCDIEVIGYIYKKEHFVSIVAVNSIKKGEKKGPIRNP